MTDHIQGRNVPKWARTVIEKLQRENGKYATLVDKLRSEHPELGSEVCIVEWMPDGRSMIEIPINPHANIRFKISPTSTLSVRLGEGDLRIIAQGREHQLLVVPTGGNNTISIKTES